MPFLCGAAAIVKHCCEQTLRIPDRIGQYGISSSISNACILGPLAEEQLIASVHAHPRWIALMVCLAV
jgi:hypothetical protein